jgi:hypothetical protein
VEEVECEWSEAGVSGVVAVLLLVKAEWRPDSLDEEEKEILEGECGTGEGAVEEVWVCSRSILS